MTKDDHDHPDPLAYVGQASKSWTCGGEMVSACLGFHAIWVSAINFSRAILTIARARFPVRNEANATEIEEYVLSTSSVGSLLIHMAVTKGDMRLLDPAKICDTRGFEEVSPDLVDFIVFQAFEMRSVDQNDLTVIPDDDPMAAVTEDVRKLCDAACTIARAKPGRANVIFGSGRPKPARDKYDLN